jgi:hypothetical protein
MDIIVTKNHQTGETDGMQVTLDGPELSTAITDFMAKEGVKFHTTPNYVFANCETCENATVVLRKEDIVELTPVWQEKLNIKDPSEKSTACVVGDWIRSIKE